MKYKLGILGGMGPLATAKLYEKIVNNTQAKCDQEHIEMLIINMSSIPDRTKAIFDDGENPVNKINEGINELIKNNCENFIIPCNTAHFFKDKFNLQGKINFIDMIKETENYLLENYSKASVCVLATSGTVKANIYGQNPKLNVNYPNSINQDKVMEIIYQTKAGRDMQEMLQEIINQKEFDIYLLACTELSIYKEKLKGNVIDAMDILVNKAIETCGKKVIKPIDRIITKEANK